MLGYFDFKDALKHLFRESDAIVEEDLACLSSSKVAVDFYTILQMYLAAIVETGMVRSIESFILEFKAQMETFDINFIVVFGGIEVLNGIEFIQAIRTLNRAYWKCSYFNMVYDMMVDDPRDLMEKTKNVARICKCIFCNSVSNYLAECRLGQRVINLLRNLDVDFIRAPQIRENQLLWLYENGFANAVSSSPLMFIHQNVNQIICDFKFKQGKFTYYDIEKMASKLNCPPERLPNCLFGSMVSFVINSKSDTEDKLTSTLRGNITESAECFWNEKEVLANRIKGDVFSLKDIVDHKSNSPALWNEISSVLSVNKNDVNKYSVLFYRCPIITNTNDLIYYPGKKSLKEFHVLVNIAQKDLVTCYCLGMLNEEMFRMLSKCCNHSCYLQDTISPSYEHQLLQRNSFKNNLEIGLKRILVCNSEKIDSPFFLNFTHSNEIQLNPHASKGGDKSHTFAMGDLFIPSEDAKNHQNAHFDQMVDRTKDETKDKYATVVQQAEDANSKTQEVTAKRTLLKRKSVNNTQISENQTANPDVNLSQVSQSQIAQPVKRLSTGAIPDKIPMAVASPVSEERIQLFKFSACNNDPPVDITSCIKEFKAKAGQNDKLKVCEFNTLPTLNDLLGSTYIHFFNDLRYINLSKMSMMYFGFSLSNIKDKNSAEKVILLFELIKRGMLHGKAFRSEEAPQVNKPNHLNFLNNENPSSYNDSLVKELSQLSAEEHVSTDKLQEGSTSQKRRASGISITIENEALIKERNFFERLSINMLETKVNMIYKVLIDFYKSFCQMEPERDEKYIDDIIKASFRENNISRILFISRFFFFLQTEFDQQSFFDYDGYQYEELLWIVQRGFQNLLKGSLLNFFFQTPAHKELSLLNNANRRLAFSSIYSTEAGTIVKMLLVKYLLMKELEKRSHAMGDILRADLQAIRVQHQSTHYSIQGILRMGGSLFMQILAIFEDGKKFNSSWQDLPVFHDLLATKSLMIEFLGFFGIVL